MNTKQVQKPEKSNNMPRFYKRRAQSQANLDNFEINVSEIKIGVT